MRAAGENLDVNDGVEQPASARTADCNAERILPNTFGHNAPATPVMPQ